MKKTVIIVYVVLFYCWNVNSQENNKNVIENQDSISLEAESIVGVIDPDRSIILEPTESVWTSGTGKIYYNGGKVGIGISSPSHKLQVYSSGWKAKFSGSDGYIMIGPANSSWAHIYTDRPNFIFNKDIYSITGSFNSYSNSNLYLKTHTTTRMTILKSNGNVGIGTSTPSKKLDVAGDINLTGNLYKNGELMEFNGVWWQDGYTSNISFTDGNVGIGTPKPQERLHIDGSVRGNQSGALRISTGNGYVDIGPKNSVSCGFYTDAWYYFFNKKIVVNEGIISSHRADLKLQASDITRMTIKTTNGNVGIGTIHPSTSLEISNGILKLSGSSFDGQSTGHASTAARFMIDTENSTGHPFLSFRNNNGVQMFVHSDGRLMCKRVETKEVWVENISMPDYVFEESYSLRSLNEVEEYINENKHLPDMPSAKQVAEEGMGLKEMNNLLLQKVEELTLYLIEIKNDNEKLKNEIELIKSNN